MLKARARSPRKANAVTEKSNLGGTGEWSIQAGVPSPVLSAPSNSIGSRSVPGRGRRGQALSQHRPRGTPSTPSWRGHRGEGHSRRVRSTGDQSTLLKAEAPRCYRSILRPQKPLGTRGLLWGPHCSLLINLFPSHDPRPRECSLISLASCFMGGGMGRRATRVCHSPQRADAPGTWWDCLPLGGMLSMQMSLVVRGVWGFNEEGRPSEAVCREPGAGGQDGPHTFPMLSAGACVLWLCRERAGGSLESRVWFRSMLCTYRFHPEDRYSMGPRPAPFSSNSTP